jgi:hypothetical protein
VEDSMALYDGHRVPNVILDLSNLATLDAKIRHFGFHHFIKDAFLLIEAEKAMIM